MTQAFKANDAVEAKVTEAFRSVLEDLIGADIDLFYEGAYSSYLLGDVLYELGHPLAGVITQDAFRTAFPQIHELFKRPGPFEYYLTLFRQIWGEDVDVEFTVPAPGKLLINIEALSVQEFLFVARRIVDDEYVYDEVIDHDGDNITFQVTVGIKTQRETDALIRELHPGGLWVEATLTLT